MPSTTARGYGHEHQQRRAALLPDAIGQPCPLCGNTMLADQPLDLDHTTPLAQRKDSLGDRITHASCNRRRSAQANTRTQGGRFTRAGWRTVGTL